MQRTFDVRNKFYIVFSMTFPHGKRSVLHRGNYSETLALEIQLFIDSI